MATATLARTNTGWCGTASHPRDDHAQTASCVAFISDAEHTAALLHAASLHDARVRCDIEARYVAEHRPY